MFTDRSPGTYLLILIALFGFGCTKDNFNNITTNCDQSIIIDNNLYQNAPDDEFNFLSADIVGDCLEITMTYGGGCGQIELKLINSGHIAESYPVQRSIRLSLKDEDYCEALITKQTSFDLVPIRVDGENQVALNLLGWTGQLLYEY